MGFYFEPCHGNSVLMKGDGDFLPGNYAIRFDDNAYTSQNNCFTNAVDTIHQNFYSVNAQTPSPGYSPYINKDQWYCIVYTYDGTAGKFYVDDVLIYSDRNLVCRSLIVMIYFLEGLNVSSFTLTGLMA